MSIAAREPAPRRGRRITWTAGAVSFVLLLVTACDSLESARSLPGPKKTLRVAVTASPASIDPHGDFGGPELQVLVNVYEGLVGFDETGALEARLASRWESVDDRRWIFHLRKGVLFHDGTSLDADDVVESFERVKVRRIAALPVVEALDSVTVEMKLASPDPLFLAKLTEVFVVSSSSRGASGPPGTGPYRFVSRDDGSIVLAGFEGHWRSEPPIARVQLLPTPDDDERARGLLEGQFDLVNRVPPGSLAEIERNPDLDVRSARSLRLDYVGLRVDRPPFDDVRVRKAVSLAIDRAAIVDRLSGGFASPANQFGDSNVHGHIPELPPLRRDLAGARGLLREAGYPAGLEITLDSASPEWSEILAHQLGEAGFRVVERIADWPAFYSRVSQGQAEAWSIAWLYSAPDLSELLEQVVHSATEGFGGYNHHGYVNADLDRLIDDLTRTSDVSDRQRLKARATTILLQDLPIVPVQVPFVTIGAHRGLQWSARHDGLLELYRVSWLEDGA